MNEEKKQDTRQLDAASVYKRIIAGPCFFSMALSIHITHAILAVNGMIHYFFPLPRRSKEESTPI